MQDLPVLLGGHITKVVKREKATQKLQEVITIINLRTEDNAVKDNRVMR